MSHDPQDASFEALNACHQQIQQHLAKLAALARHLEVQGLDHDAQQLAGDIEAFFSGTSRQHHEDEEKTVFPPLLASANAELVAAVRTLQQDHGWIEANWLELSPQLQAIASGNSWFEPAEFQHNADVFIELYQGHIALEEALAYPEARAYRAQAEASGAHGAGRRP